ncbi:MAG: TonB-dependent receptor, partial [Microthrixaceae bacterium]|nr:TonB-dependent receptor [Microthrixaceae bacterium]
AYTGFRLPTLNELYRPFVVFPITTKANPALKPERLRGVEGGFDLTPVDGGVRVGGTSGLVDATGKLLIVGDPKGLPISGLLRNLSQRAPELGVLGGLAPPVGVGRAAVLLEGVRVRTGGVVGVHLGDDINVRSFVAQGCRPVGEPMAVTGVDGSSLTELAGRSPMERIRELAGQLDPGDRELAAGGLHLGVVVDEHRLDYGRGDFVIRSVMGADRRSGALLLAEPPPLGATVQFQVRDPAGADADLDELAGLAGPAEAALVFACAGRGTNLFDAPHHDAERLVDLNGVGALAGMFCAGEIGPIHGAARVHSFSAAVALF